MAEHSLQEKIRIYAGLTPEVLFQEFKTSALGLAPEQITKQREIYGNSQILGFRKNTLYYCCRRAFVNPFAIVLLILASISFLTDYFAPATLKYNYVTVTAILAMLLISGLVRLLQEFRSKQVADRLTALVNSTCSVCRGGVWQQLPANALVAGDIIRLRAGERVPADCRLLKTRDCFVSQAVITGESAVQEKLALTLQDFPDQLLQYSNLLFANTNIISGTCTALVLGVGQQTVYNNFSLLPLEHKQFFYQGANAVAWVLIRFMALLVPIVFVTSGLTKGDWLVAFLFALSVAVGLMPELLPMVVNACLAKGSYTMGKKKTVVKNINAMQGFGSMDVLCVDKTGTLTGDSLQLEYYMDILGNESTQVLDFAFLNSYYHSGVKNHLDSAILKVQAISKQKEHYARLIHSYSKLDELPFDYQRRLTSILLAGQQGQILLTKGSLQDVLKRCSHIEYKGQLHPLAPTDQTSVHAIVDDLLEDGMKILAVAYKDFAQANLTQKDESGLILLGYLAFFDAPKASAATAIKKLRQLQVQVKVLTGDNMAVAQSIGYRVGLDCTQILTGAQLQQLTDNDLPIAIENTTIFAELSPQQKQNIVQMLQGNGHTVGFLGDGMNDLPAMVEADVGISVDTAAPAVKEIADVILFKKDLLVLEEGILEGRRAFSNMSKYIKITASSNLGNIIAIVIAGITLPFFPITSLQILLLNMLYDIICLVLPWDNVDKEMCARPLEWSGKKLSRFMTFFGPLSSIFDVLTFLFLYFYLCPYLCGGSYGAISEEQQIRFLAFFQTGWFLESMWSQVLILHLLRTTKLPLLQSKSSPPVLVVTLIGVIGFTGLVMTPLGAGLGLTPLPPIYFVFLTVIVASYLCFVTLAKKFYVQRYQELF